MRARVLFVAGLVTSVLGACSNPPVETGLEQDDQLAASLELALTEASQGEQPAAVASEIEAPRPVAAPRRPPRKPVVAPPKPDVDVPVAEPEPEPEAAPTPAPEAEPSFTLSPMLRTPAEVVADGGTAPRSGPSAGGWGGEDDDLRRGGTIEGGGTVGRGPGIIIRGGGSGRDPCAVHMPGRGGILGGVIPGGVLINERGPRVGNPTLPGSGGGRTASPRGGGFRGGIR